MRKYLFITVFVSGMASLALEMAASRLLGNIFGTSNLVWASVIGLILIYLAVGYSLGGYWADRSPSYRTFFRILLVASIFITIIPLVSQPILKLAANAFDELQLGTLLGSFLAVLILLSIPMTLLGTTSPFAIRLAVQNENELGKTAGRIYAISTMGSFVGTFLPVLLLIPTIGTFRTFLVIGSTLFLFSLVGLWKIGGWKGILPFIWLAILPGLAWMVHSSIKATPNQIYEAESAYNYIQVLQMDDYTLLRLNEGQGIHSVYNPNQLNYFGSWEQVLVAPYFNPAPYLPERVKSMAIVGLAAGTTARQASIAYPGIQIDGYEIDPEIVDIGHKYFDMTEPGLNIITQDGRWGLEHSKNLYQVISVDAYRPPYIPAHLTTIEFFDVVRKHLSEDGVLVINVGRSPTDRSLINALATTIRSVFPSIYVVDIPNTFNSMIFATVQETTAQNLLQNYAWMQQVGNMHPLIMETLQVTLSNIQPEPPTTIAFTDDRAPVEWITNNMVLSFIFSEGLGEIQ